MARNLILAFLLIATCLNVIRAQTQLSDSDNTANWYDKIRNKVQNLMTHLDQNAYEMYSSKSDEYKKDMKDLFNSITKFDNVLNGVGFDRAPRADLTVCALSLAAVYYFFRI